MFGKYTKAITALVSAAIAWATIVQQSAPVAITSAEWLGGAVLLAGALGVYGVINKAP